MSDLVRIGKRGKPLDFRLGAPEILAMSFDEAVEHFSYDQGTGSLTRKKTTSSNAKKGDVCSGINGHGYVAIKFKKRIAPVHRIIWLMMTGSFPDRQVDHINGNRADNRWCNLRLADIDQQHFNTVRKKLPSSGAVGVRKVDDKYLVRVKHRGVDVFSKRFDTIEEARSAYLAEKNRLNPEFFPSRILSQLDPKTPEDK